MFRKNNYLQDKSFKENISNELSVVVLVEVEVGSDDGAVREFSARQRRLRFLAV